MKNHIEAFIAGVPLSELRKRYEQLRDEVHRRLACLPEYDDRPSDEEEFDDVDMTYILTNCRDTPELVSVVGSDAEGLLTLDGAHIQPDKGDTNLGDLLCLLEKMDGLPHEGDRVRWNDPDNGRSSREGVVTRIKYRGDRMELQLDKDWATECPVGEVEILEQGAGRLLHQGSGCHSHP